MIIPPGPLKVLVATQPVDFRKAMVGLAALVQRELHLDPFSGMLFIFRARRADKRMHGVLCAQGTKARSEAAFDSYLLRAVFKFLFFFF